MPALATPLFPSDAARRAFLGALVLNLIWINASEIFRYFLFVMPMMRAAFPQLDGVADMSLGIFLVWGVWDTILWLAACGFSWFFLERFGAGAGQAILAGTLLWAAVFVILWLGLFNMGLAPAGVLAVALPLAWLEMVVAALIMRRGWRQAQAMP